MEYQQLSRVISVLSDMVAQGIEVENITTEMAEDPLDPDFLEPVVSIKYQRSDQQTDHEIRVYYDGSMSDF